MLARQGLECVATEHLRRSTASCNAGVFQSDAQQETVECGRIFQIQLFFASLHFVKGRLCNVDMATLHQVRHLTVEEGEQQGANVRAVNVGVGHDDDAVVAQFVDIEVVGAALARVCGDFANAGAKRCDQRDNFSAGQQLFVTCFFDVQDLAAQGQNGLEFTVTSLLGGATRGVALDDVNFAKRWIFFLAVGQFTRQAHAIEHTFAARHLAGFACCFAGACGFHNFAAQNFGVVGALF